MSDYLWKVKAVTNWGKVVKGMEVDVIVRNNTGKPTTDAIRDALEAKYNITIGGGMPSSTFDFQKG